MKDPSGAGKRFIATYWGWRLLQNAATQLSKRYRDSAFEFDKIYSGVKEEPPRWRTCVDYTNSAMKLAAGSIYVDAYFGVEAKSKVLNASLLRNWKFVLSGNISRGG